LPCQEKLNVAFTGDNGENWDFINIPESKKKDSYLNINNAFFIDGDNIILVANEGLILRSSNGGESWTAKKFKENNYTALYFLDAKKGFIAGNGGAMIYTADGGEKWRTDTLPAYKTNIMLKIDNEIWAIGDTGMAMRTETNQIKWKGIEGRSFIADLINFFAPFIFIWLIFLLLYSSLPNTKVPFKSASIGAAFTGAVWVVFILLFGVYVKQFAKGTFAVYGALASIPLFLLMIYASSVIILYGAEITYTLMHPDTYRNLIRILKPARDIHVYYGIAVLHQIYEKFEKGQGSTSFPELLKAANNQSEEVDYFNSIFEKEGLIVKKTDNTYVPANSSHNLKIADIIDLIHDKTLAIPAAAKPSTLRTFMSKMFIDATKSRRKIFGEMTLREVIEKGMG